MDREIGDCKTLGYIYLITNLQNGIGYVGQTRNSIENRWKGHVIQSKNSDFAISRAIRKYGELSFKIELLETCPIEQIDIREQYWIECLGTFKNGYNCTSGGGSGYLRNEEFRQRLSDSKKGAKNPNYGKSPSSETRKKMSAATTKENNPFYGRHHSDETKQILSDLMKGEKAPNYGRPFTEDHKRRMSEAKKGEKNPNFNKPWTDEVRKKLIRVGSKNGHAKLTEAQARLIKFSLDPSRLLATKYKVSMSTIQNIRNGKIWKHISNDEGFCVDKAAIGLKGQGYNVAVVSDATQAIDGVNGPDGAAYSFDIFRQKGIEIITTEQALALLN